MDTIKNKFSIINEICKQINDLTSIISYNKIEFFPSISIQIKFSNPEHCFENIISWFYVRCIEISGKNLDFIQKKMAPNNIFLSTDGLNFKRLIHAFRTMLQHNLDIVNSPRDQGIKNTCDEWIRHTIGIEKPESDDDWKKLVDRVIDDSIEYFKGIKQCLHLISESEHTDVVAEEWERITKRNYSIHEFEQVLIKVLDVLGLTDFFDPHNLTKLHSDKWMRQLEILPDNFNFQDSAYKIIENFIIENKIIPIDGHDVISIGIPKGPMVSTIINKAKELFASKPCTKEQLLDQLKEYIR
jgi:hypothetical protein